MKVIFLVTYVLLAAVIAFRIHVDREDRKMFRSYTIEGQRENDLAAYRASAKTKDEKTLVAFELDRDFAKEVKQFSIANGVDQYRAWMLARSYFLANFGVCGIVGLPQRVGEKWRVHMAFGSSAIPGTIIVDAWTGMIECDGHPTVFDAVSFIKHLEMPNHSPDPKLSSVTSAAEPAAAPAGRSAH